MMPAFEVSRCHQLMIEYLEELLSGEIKKLAIITPPRMGKTTLGNVMAPAFALGRNPTETVITVSYGSELSETWGRRVRNILSDPAFREVFPPCELSPDSAAAYRFTTTAGGEYSAVGRGGPVTGRGASLLILDDLIKDSSEANSDTVCRGIIEWLQHVAFTRLTPTGRVLAIATRWSERDPMGWILQQRGWTVLHLPAIAENTADPLGREIGEAVWPSRYPVEALEAIRADVGPRVFQTLYQGNVSASQGTIFKRDWFRHYDRPPELFSRIIQSWDTAFKTGATNDYSVCATFGETQNGFYLLALYRAKVEFPELKRQVAQQANLWRPSEIYVEDKASGQSLIQELKLATTYPIIPVKIDRDKEVRASAVTGYFESGRVLFPEGAAWVSDLEDELAGFPGGLHDDCVDAISQALNQLRDSRGCLGLVDLIKDLSTGKRKMPAEEILHVESSKKPNDKCPACQSAATIWQSDGYGGRIVHCNQCGRNDGKESPESLGCAPGCPALVRQFASGRIRCGNCGRYQDQASTAVGMSRADYLAGRGFGQSYRRFRR
jgi:predicted phage terminase large subunit-like protein